MKRRRHRHHHEQPWKQFDPAEHRRKIRQAVEALALQGDAAYQQVFTLMTFEQLSDDDDPIWSPLNEARILALEVLLNHDILQALSDRRLKPMKKPTDSYGPACSEEAVRKRLAELEDTSPFQGVREFEADGKHWRATFEAPVWHLYQKQGDAFIHCGIVACANGVFSGPSEIMAAYREMEDES